MLFLQQEEVEKVSKHDFYMAALTAEVRRGWVSEPENINNEDFLIAPNLTGERSLNNKTKSKPKERNEAEQKLYVANSKNCWLGLCKIEPGGEE